MSLPHQNRLAQFGQLLLLLLRYLCCFLLLLLRQHRRCCNRCAKKLGGIFRQKNVVACVGTKYKNKNPNCFEKVKSLSVLTIQGVSTLMQLDADVHLRFVTQSGMLTNIPFLSIFSFSITF